jgi:hypothetical protein
MALNLLQIIQRVAPRLGYRAPTLVLTSQDLNIQIIASFAQEEGDELVEKHDWNVLTVENTQVTLAAIAQTAFPDDFARFAEKAEIWNRSKNLKYQGPTEPRIWDELKSGNVSAGYIGWWRIIGGVLQLFPAPSAGDTLAYTYISNKWAAKADGTPQSGFLLDSDVPRLPDKLFTTGIRWRYRAMRGLDYAEDLETYERLKESIGSHDRGLRVIRKSAASRRSDGMPPTTTWPGTIQP